MRFVETPEETEQRFIRNIYTAGPTGFEAAFNYICVLEDEFRSGYECQTCDAKGRIPCTECEDGKSKLNPDIVCKTCHGEKSVTCPDCDGKKEFIVVPDKAKTRPTSGQVVSCGKTVQEWQIGDRVLYPSFRGEVIDLKGLDAKGIESVIVLRFLKDSEVICRLHGDPLKLSRWAKRQTELGE
jgi:co-chaperonin GroES (HSP10)